MHGLFNKGQIEVGMILKLNEFQVVHYEYSIFNGLAPTNLLVLCLKVSVHAKQDLFFSQDILKTKKPPIKPVDVISSIGKATTSSWPMSYFTQVDVSNDEDDLGNCNGGGCSKHGVHSVQCICKTHPVRLLDPKQLFDACHFIADSEILGNDSKRLAYY